MHIELDRVPLRATGMTPAEILSSESQERMCAVVTPENVDAFLAVCAKWDTLATVIGEVTDGDRLVITWHGETVVDVPPRTVAHDGPVYAAPGRPLGEPGRAGRGRAGPAAPARGPVRAARGDPADGGVAEPVQPGVGHRSVRPLRPRQHRVRPARRRRDRPRRRGDRARDRRRDRLQRPLRRARPVRGHPARARRGLPQRRDVRRRAAGRDELPQLRLAGGPARHVAVRRGGARARRRLRGAGHPGDGRQRQLLQPDRLDGDPADAGGGRARPARRRRAPGPQRVRARRRRRAAARDDARRARRQRVGPRRARAPGRPPAAGRPRRRAAARRSCSPRPPRTAC